MSSLLQIQSMFLSGGRLGTIALIVLFYVLAWVVHKLVLRIALFVINLDFFSSIRRHWRAERLETLRGLMASTIVFAAYMVATLATLALFVDTDSLVWTVGLFSAAFGLGARPLISDYLTGTGFIFEDSMDVGDKVEFILPNGPIEGVIESITLRTVMARAPGGELLVIPNGEIRVIRNFSRGRYSTIKIRLKIAGDSIEKAIPVLEDLGSDAMTLLPNLLEPWEILGTGNDEIDKHGMTVTLVAKAKFGQGAKLRPRLLAEVRKRFIAYDIELID